MKAFSFQATTPPVMSQRAWQQWLQTGLGAALHAEECQALEKLIPPQYYPVGVQIGLMHSSLMSELNIGLPLRLGLVDEVGLNDAQEAVDANVIGAPEALPLAEHSADLVVMLHVLELCEDPLRSLRETAQVLAPEGVLAVTGFNPLSFWGARAVFSRRSGHPPWAGRYFRVKTLQDWLALLGLELIAGGMLDYRLPLQNEKWRERLRWLDKVGDRWWPGLGGVYVLVLKKQVYGKTPRPNVPVKLKRWLGGWVPAPVGRSSAKSDSRKSPSG